MKRCIPANFIKKNPRRCVNVLMTYVHDVNANVEEKRKYLSDVVQVSLEEVKKLEEVVGYLVKAMPAVISEYEEVQITPVHPKTETITKSMPKYTVPTKLTVQVRVPVADRKQETANEQVMNWTTEEVVVEPIVIAEFTDEAPAQAYYQAVIAHLHEGTDVRTVPVGVVRDSYEADNSRYPGF